MRFISFNGNHSIAIVLREHMRDITLKESEKPKRERESSFTSPAPISTTVLTPVLLHT